MLFCGICTLGLAQETGIVKGIVVDKKGVPIIGVNIGVIGEAIGTASDGEGKFELELPADKLWEVIFSHVNYYDYKRYIRLSPDEVFDIKQVPLKEKTLVGKEVTIFSQRDRSNPSIIVLNPKLVRSLPSASGNIEDLIKTLPGVSSSNELSSQYSVRGGNFDENLVYVNDFEIYRPFLVRSGQQEGLSFVNSDLVDDILFSSGGFQAKYGDKMASVLDITYKKPRRFGGSAPVLARARRPRRNPGHERTDGTASAATDSVNRSWCRGRKSVD